MNPKKPRSNCLACGTTVKRPQDVYCDNRCQGAHEHQVFMTGWLAGAISGLRADGIVSAHVRKYLKERSQEKCEWCGWDARHPVTGEVPLEAHHIDGKHENNTPENLAYICPNCHSLTETYRGRNRGNGRKTRMPT